MAGNLRGPGKSPSGEGPLAGIKVIEFAGIGPGPFCAMMLSDMSADVVRIDRSPHDLLPDQVTHRGRSSIVLDLKSDAGRAVALDAMMRADIAIEGYRPGVMERLGLGPDTALASNPRLIYGRMTGWGQTGPLSQKAGHDINYIALTGVLGELGKKGKLPTPPLNLIGDFGGGAMLLTLGIVAALYERQISGQGQVIDASIVDGTALLMAMFSGMKPGLPIGRGINPLGGSQPSYRCYRCKDGLDVAVGAIEPEFWGELADAIGLTPDERSWRSSDLERLHARMETIFLSATRAEWCARLADFDACFSPILSLAEAPAHAHNQARGTYVHIDGVDHPAPAPRFSRTMGEIQGRSPKRGEGGVARLKSWGVNISR